MLDRGYLTQDELASRMGKTQGSISNKLRLLNLSQDVQDALLNNQISERHARSLLKIENEDEQIEILNRIIKERLNVRDTDNLINSFINGEEYVQVAAPRGFGLGKGSSNNSSSIDFNTFFDSNETEENGTLEIEDKTYPAIEDKVYPSIEDKVYPAIEKEETLLLEEETDDTKKKQLQTKIKGFIESLKEEGFLATYDSYEFDKIFEFIIKIEK